MILPQMSLSARDAEFIRQAADYLERPGFLMKVTNLVGKPAEAILGMLPKRAQSMIGDATKTALEKSLDWAVRTLPEDESPPLWRFAQGPRFHTTMAATTGAVGGFFGLAGTAIEIPATTVVMLRSIAEIAEQNGSDLRDPAVRLQCLAVFSFGSPRLEAMESAYFSSRFGVAVAIGDAARYMAQRGAQQLGTGVSHTMAPALVRLVNQIAARFEIVISQKVAAQAVPVAGAATGSLINAAFADHFRRVAEYHFGIVRLERTYSEAVVQAAYRQAVDRSKRTVA